MIEAITLHNTVLGNEIHINMDEGEYWLAEADFGQVESTVNTFKFLNQIGETVYDTSIGPRSISITGWVAGWDEERVSTLKQFLNRFVNPKNLIELYANNMKISFYPKTSVRYSPIYKENNSVMCKFLISGYCPYPLFTDKNQRTQSVAYTESLFHFPLIIPANKGIVFGVRHPSLIAEVMNDGDMPIGYIIEFRAHGTVTNPMIIDINTQESIEIVKSMEDSEVIIVDTREGSRSVKGVIQGEEINYFKYRNLDSGWLTLARGSNYLRYNAESGVENLEVYIRYEPGYLEVDR